MEQVGQVDGERGDGCGVERSGGGVREQLVHDQLEHDGVDVE